jgi:hypothetical protein
MTPDVLSYFEQRFGIKKSQFKDFRFYSDQKGRVLLGPKNLIADRLIVSMGLQAASVNDNPKSAEPASVQRFKPSTNFLQLFGKHATKNFVALSKEQTQAYLRGEDIQLTSMPKGVTEGYILLKYMDYPLACGLLKGSRIKNVLPKARRMKIEFI